VFSADLLKEGLDFVPDRVDKKREASCDGNDLDRSCGKRRRIVEFLKQPLRRFLID
jgi:hypothetical protein